MYSMSEINNTTEHFNTSSIYNNVKWIMNVNRVVITMFFFAKWFCYNFVNNNVMTTSTHGNTRRERYGINVIYSCFYLHQLNELNR